MTFETDKVMAEKLVDSVITVLDDNTVDLSPWMIRQLLINNLRLGVEYIGFMYEKGKKE